MRPLRSLLYVPGDKEALFPKAVAARPDGLVLDLEDAVALDRKSLAREAVAAWLRRERETGVPTDFVRLNGAGPSQHDDLAAVVPARPAGLLVPKVERVEEVQRLDHVLSYLEHVHGLPNRGISLLLILETAAAVADCRALASCSPRVATVVGGAARGGDVNRSIGYEWSPEGLESLHLRSHVVLQARAAGVRFPLYSGWMNVRDLDGLEADARRNRALGFTGAVVIHPSHVPLMNRVFTPSSEEVARLRRLLAAFEAAEAQGIAAIDFEGDMVDYAMARTAREILALGVDA